MFSNIHNDRCAWIQQHPYVLPLSWQCSLVLLLSLGTVLLLRVTIPFTFLFGIFNLLIINICLLSRFCDALLIIHLKLLGTFFLVVVRSFFFSSHALTLSLCVWKILPLCWLFWKNIFMYFHQLEGVQMLTK